MKYKKLSLDVDITLRGIPNKKKDAEFLYHYQGTTTLEKFLRLLGLIEDWYPKNKRRISQNH